MAELTATTPVDEHDRYSLHPEDWVTQQDSHLAQLTYFVQAFREVRPDLFVGGDLAVYWVPGEYEHPYVGPDVLVSRHHPPQPDPRVYEFHKMGPLSIVAEIASQKTRGKEKAKRDDVYAAILRVPEYLLVDLQRRRLEFSVLVGEQYEPVAPNAQGWLWSEELGLGFTWQEDKKLVRVVSAAGAIVPTHDEVVALRKAAERQARREARRADQETRRADQEARRAADEARARIETEQRADEADRRAEALAAEVERLQRLLEDRDGPPAPS